MEVYKVDLSISKEFIVEATSPEEAVKLAKEKCKKTFEVNGKVEWITDQNGYTNSIHGTCESCGKFIMDHEFCADCVFTEDGLYICGTCFKELNVKKEAQEE